METLPHVMLVGEGAERFAKEMGFEKRDLLTNYTRSVWEEGLKRILSPEEIASGGRVLTLWKMINIVTDPERAGSVKYITSSLGRKRCRHS